jgi:hypothetical protein
VTSIGSSAGVGAWRASLQTEEAGSSDGSSSCRTAGIWCTLTAQRSVYDGQHFFSRYSPGLAQLEGQWSGEPGLLQFFRLVHALLRTNSRVQPLSKHAGYWRRAQARDSPQSS